MTIASIEQKFFLEISMIFVKIKISLPIAMIISEMTNIKQDFNQIFNSFSAKCMTDHTTRY